MILVFGSINIDLLVPVRELPRPGETVLGGDYASWVCWRSGSESWGDTGDGGIVARRTSYQSFEYDSDESELYGSCKRSWW